MELGYSEVNPAQEGRDVRDQPAHPCRRDRRPLTHSPGTLSATTAEVIEQERLLQSDQHADGRSSLLQVENPYLFITWYIAYDRSHLSERDGRAFASGKEPRPTGAVARPQQPPHRRAVTGLTRGEPRPLAHIDQSTEPSDQHGPIHPVAQPHPNSDTDLD